MKFRLTLTLFIAFTSLFGQENSVTVILAGNLIDTETGNILTNQKILIEDDIIRAVGPNIDVPKGAEVIDLSEYWLLPGLVDCHTHLQHQFEDIHQTTFPGWPVDNALLIPGYAERTLMAGFTTVRNMGAEDFSGIALKKAIDAGRLPGPRMQVSGLFLNSTNGAVDYRKKGFSNVPEEFSMVADGETQIRQKIRHNVKYGADWIKVMAGGSAFGTPEQVSIVNYTDEELKTFVDEAKRWNRDVAAHAHSAEAIKAAARAGVTSIEHGSLLDAEGATMIREKGIYLVTDVYAGSPIIAKLEKEGNEKRASIEREFYRKQKMGFEQAIKAELTIVFGTDAGVIPHGDNAKQFAVMVDWGMTPIQALQSATITASKLLRWEDKIGSIKVGKWADIIAVKINPLQDISSLEKVLFVMKGGKIYKNVTSN